MRLLKWLFRCRRAKTCPYYREGAVVCNDDGVASTYCGRYYDHGDSGDA